MGIKHFKCDRCGGMGSDAYIEHTCAEGHHICDCIGMYPLVDDDEGYILECPVCKDGGTDSEKLEMANAVLLRIWNRQGEGARESHNEVTKYLRKQDLV